MIFFDIDDTLTDSIRAHKTAIRQCASDQLEVEDWEEAGAVWMTITDTYLMQYFQGNISVEEQRTGRLISFWKNYNRILSASGARDLYDEYHRCFLQSCVLFDDVVPALDRLSGHRLGIISNGLLDDQHFKLKNNGIFDRFDDLIISEEIGISKPDRRIFIAAAERSGQRISSCFYIGDNYDVDYKAAKDAGMKSFWLNRNLRRIEGFENGFQGLNDVVPAILDGL